MSVMREEFPSSFAEETAGAILATARQERNLDVADVSSRLRLSIWQVEALENDEYDRLPGSTFVRGIIRGYAKALQIDPQPALDAYGRLVPEAEQVPINVPSQNIRFNPQSPSSWNLSMKAVFILVILAAIGVAVWFLFIVPGDGPRKLLPVIEVKPAEVKPAREVARPEVPAQAVDITAKDTSVAVSPGNNTQNAQTASAPASAPAAYPMPPPAVQPTAESSVLHFVFPEDSWVEVKDATGKTMLHQLNRAGTEQVLTGRPPFSLVIGNAHLVQLSYNDKPVDIIPHIRVRVARFTLP